MSITARGISADSGKTYKAPGADPHVYAVYVDSKDMVWASEWGNNAMLRFAPGSDRRLPTTKTYLFSSQFAPIEQLLR